MHPLSSVLLFLVKTHFRNCFSYQQFAIFIFSKYSPFSLLKDGCCERTNIIPINRDIARKEFVLSVWRIGLLLSMFLRNQFVVLHDSNRYVVDFYAFSCIGNLIEF